LGLPGWLKTKVCVAVTWRGFAAMATVRGWAAVLPTVMNGDSIACSFLFSACGSWWA
jgi:hypothetical protein